MKRLIRRREKAPLWYSDLPPRVHRKLTKISKASRKLIVVKASKAQYENTITNSSSSTTYPSARQLSGGEIQSGPSESQPNAKRQKHQRTNVGSSPGIAKQAALINDCLFASGEKFDWKYFKFDWKYSKTIKPNIIRLS
ncbi:hypothetical protein WN944_019509 [Citrus x changshan-huyou]|uniref:Uncharacterized protein n=1 Tax=Citrus x changshan-huyou TaxID=2935761 RepID=A0AAP0LYQ7_9ROSI